MTIQAILGVVGAILYGLLLFYIFRNEDKL
jgi:hypothetical protein